MKRRNVVQMFFAGLMGSFTRYTKANFWSHHWDIIVVGGGGAGLSAAVRATELGASVLLLEKSRNIGGNTLIASGLFNAVDPRRQQPMGIHDSLSWHYQQMMQSGQGKNDASVVHRFVLEALPTLHWLEKMGVGFMDQIYTTWGAEWARGHKPVMPRGSGYIHVLSERFLRLGGEIRVSHPVTKLLWDESQGRVCGVRVTVEENEKKQFFADKGVILASGGFGANKEMIARWAGDLVGMPTDNVWSNTGDLLPLAEEVGAQLINMECIQTVPGAPQGRTFQVRLDLDVGRCLLVDNQGRRFVDEDLSRAQLTKAILEREPVFTVTNQAAIDSYDLISQKNIYKGLHYGDTWRAFSLKELAKQMGVSARNLQNTFIQYQQEVRNKKGKCGRIECHRISRGPYWASPVVLNVHSTMGGIVINAQAQVCDQNYDAIPGLWAAGEVTGNVHGANRIGGNGIADAITFGKLAAEDILADHKM